MIPSKARSLIGLESHSMASGRIFRVCLNFLSSATSLCVTESKVVGSLEIVIQGLQTLSAAHRVNQYSHGQKLSHFLALSCSSCR